MDIPVAATEGFTPARITNDFMFARVMRERPDLCKMLIERVLGVQIERIEEADSQVADVSVAGRSVRFDVYLRADAAAFCVELQCRGREHLPERILYYRSHMVHRLLGKGERYARLIPTYIIFLCTYDPFGAGLPVYTLRPRCEELPGLDIGYPQLDVIVNARADQKPASEGIARLIEFMKSGEPAPGDDLTSGLARAVDDINRDEREWVSTMMTMELSYQIDKDYAVRESFEKGKAEGEAEGEARGRAEGEAGLMARLRELQAAGKSLEEALDEIEASASAE